MPLNRTAWTDIIGSDGTPTTVSAGAQSSADIDVNATNLLHRVGVKVSVLFGGTPDGPTVVNVYGKDADNANEQDTEALLSFSIPEATSTEKRRSFQIDSVAADTLTIEVDNQDTTDSVDVWVSYIGAYF